MVNIVTQTARWWDVFFVNIKDFYIRTFNNSGEHHQFSDWITLHMYLSFNYQKLKTWLNVKWIKTGQCTRVQSTPKCLPPVRGPWRPCRGRVGDTGSTGPSVWCCVWRAAAGTRGHLHTSHVSVVMWGDWQQWPPPPTNTEYLSCLIWRFDLFNKMIEYVNIELSRSIF